MGAIIKDKSAGEQVLRRSELEWTIVYPSLLTDRPANGSIAVLPEGAKRRMSERISRAAVAAWMLQGATGVQ
jgi:putative NAD(P)-binding protein